MYIKFKQSKKNDLNKRIFELLIYCLMYFDFDRVSPGSWVPSMDFKKLA